VTIRASTLRTFFVFASPESPGKTVLIFDVNPFMTGADG